MARHTNRNDPNQLSMLMTAKEIQTRYQVLDGDREEGYDSREGSATGRSRTTGGNPNQPGPLGSAIHFRGGHEESDEQVWSRKLEESQMSPGDYHEARAGEPARTPGWETLGQRSSFPQVNERTGRSWTSMVDSHDMRGESYVNRKQEEFREHQDYGPSLYESLQASGGPDSPVHLGTKHGSMGKPQVVGGHHRIAAMAHINPDQLIPVLHHENLHDARSTATVKAYPYT